MIYPSDFEIKTGFDGIRARLSEICLGTLGRKHVEEMTFSTDFSDVRHRLLCVKEMRTALEIDPDMPSDNFHDLVPELKRLQVEGSFATAETLLKLGKTLVTSAAIRSKLCAMAEEKFKYPSLGKDFSAMTDLTYVAASIDRVINKFGKIKDTASPRLAEIRSEISRIEASMSGILRRIISKFVSEGVLDKDTTATMRDGRMVIPVLASNKRKVPGIVHDESATGHTSFIEPAEAVEAGNKLRECQIQEKREEVIVLTALCAEIRPYISEIIDNLDLMGYYDFIRAKAIYSSEVNGEMPVLEKHPGFDWYGAVHPGLLISLRSQKRDVVPLNLSLNKEQRILLISGPNAGGKSVALKTVAVVQYMTQCGVLPTLYSNSHVGIFDKIMIDIGDQQSIENDLSTYSSHLRNMKFFLANAGKRSLLLADELGSGTEPQIGGALAQAILAELAKSGCYGIVTTHYNNLKTFAESTPGFVNGAMLYDRQHLSPLFKLSIGSAGSSFALEIARKSGLPANVIESAKEIVGSDYVNMDKYLLDIARDRKYWADKRQRIRQLEKQNEQRAEEIDERVEELKTKRNNIINEARREAKDILSSTNALIEKSIHEIRRVQAEKEQTKAVRQSIADYKASIEKENQPDNKLDSLKVKRQKRKEKKPVAKPEQVLDTTVLKEGDYVKMPDSNVIGRIISITGKQAEVAFGAIKTRMELSKLKAAKKPSESASVQSTSLGRVTSDEHRKSQLKFKPEIDLRGMRVDEALQAVTYFIDDAVRFNQTRVRILHGTGTGALRMAIRQLLQSTPAVRNFADEDVRFGGAGITVVNLE